MTNLTPSEPVKGKVSDAQSKAVLPRTVPSHLLMVSILEQLCLMYAKDETKGRELFKGIYHSVESLKKMLANVLICFIHVVLVGYHFRINRDMLRISKNQIQQQQNTITTL